MTHPNIHSRFLTCQKIHYQFLMSNIWIFLKTILNQEYQFRRPFCYYIKSQKNKNFVWISLPKMTHQVANSKTKHTLACITTYLLNNVWTKFLHFVFTWDEFQIANWNIKRSSFRLLSIYRLLYSIYLVRLMNFLFCQVKTSLISLDRVE